MGPYISATVKKNQPFSIVQSEVVMCNAYGMKRERDVIAGFSRRFRQAVESSQYAKPLCKNQTETLAKLFDVNISVISDWRNGGKLPSAKNIVQIGDALDISLDWLLSGHGPMRRTHHDNGDGIEEPEWQSLPPEARIKFAQALRAVADQVADYKKSQVADE